MNPKRKSLADFLFAVAFFVAAMCVVCAIAYLLLRMFGINFISDLLSTENVPAGVWAALLSHRSFRIG